MKVRSSLLIWLAGLAVLITAACTSPGLSPELRDAQLSIPDSTSLVRSNDLRVAPLDVLNIKVFGVDELNGSYQVDPQGQIRMPLVGVINAKGQSIFDLSTQIEQRLGESFLQDPQVSVRIEEAFGQQITVEGSVAKPGMYPVRGAMTLLQAVAVSGGTTELANPKRVVVFRTIEGERRAAGFNLVDIRNGRAEDPVVFGNDIIVVDGNETKQGYREFVRSIPLLGIFVAAF